MGKLTKEQIRSQHLERKAAAWDAILMIARNDPRISGFTKIEQLTALIRSKAKTLDLKLEYDEEQYDE